MIKNALIWIFIVIFLVFSLDYFHLLPDDKTLGLKRITNVQIDQINNYNMPNEQPQEESKKFTDRISSK